MFRALCCALGMLVLAACSEDHGPGADGGTDAGVSLDAGPRDAGGGADAGDAGSCVPMPIVEPSLLPACDFCMGRCVSGDGLDDETRSLLRDCSDTHECVPDEFLATGGNYLPDPCRSIFGVEGRCVSTCIEGLGTDDLLPQDVCDDAYVCAPCYDPIDGTETGACSQGCDEGPVEPPFVLSECCDGSGTCVPAEAIDEEDRGYVEECTDADGLCVPDVFLDDPGYTPPSCTTDAIQAEYGTEYADGGCVPACLAGVSDFASFLEQNDCEAGSLCVPCTSPIDDTPTGACPGGSPPSDGGVVADAGTDAG